jgi:hypothetical protein
MAQLDERARVLEEWLRLPASRRQHPTDVVAFAYRLLQERPEWFPTATRHEHIVAWLLPHLADEVV